MVYIQTVVESSVTTIFLDLIELMGALHNFYSPFPKNSRELKIIASDLGIQIKK